jgi:hypothetical protein
MKADEIQRKPTKANESQRMKQMKANESRQKPTNESK